MICSVVCQVTQVSRWRVSEGEMEAMQRDMAVARVAAGAGASVLRGARAACVLLPLLLFLT